MVKVGELARKYGYTGLTTYLTMSGSTFIGSIIFAGFI